DSVQLNGLDAEGTIIAIATQVIDPIAEGQTGEVDFLVAGGDPSGGLRKHMPVSVLDDVVGWDMGKFQPFLADGERVLLQSLPLASAGSVDAVRARSRLARPATAAEASSRSPQDRGPAPHRAPRRMGRRSVAEKTRRRSPRASVRLRG